MGDEMDASGVTVFSPLTCGVECKMLVTTKVRLLKSMLLVVLHSCMKQLFASLLQWIPDTTHTIIITITTTSHHYISSSSSSLLLSFSSHTSGSMNCIFVHSFSLSLYTATYIVYVRCIPFIHSFIYKWLSPFDSYESEPT